MYESTQQKTHPAIYIALIISRIIILFGIWLVFFRQQDTSSVVPVVDEEGTRYFIGEQVLLEGTLVMSDDISQFSHILTTKEKTTFGVKSFDVALNGYNGQVQIRGEITGFKQQMPIIQVADVVGVKGDAVESSGAALGNSYSYIKGANLGVDLSIFPGFTIEKMGNDIQLLDATSTKLLTISPFVCTPGDALKDCKVIKNALEGAQRFTNAAGMVFFKFPETERWMSFDGNQLGYTLVAEPDVELQTYGSIFEIIDPTLFDSRLDEMKMLCKDINSRLATITTHEVVIADDGTVKIGIDGSTSAGVATNCVISSSLLDPTRFSLLSYVGPTTPEDLPEEEAPSVEVPDETGSETPKNNDTTPTTVTAPAGYADWTVYPSVRGRTMYVEKNIVSYNGELGTGQVGCPYRLDLSYWSNATGASADSVIYECAPDGASTLKNAGWSTIGVSTGVEFLRKDMTDTLKNVDVYIQ